MCSFVLERMGEKGGGERETERGREKEREERERKKNDSKNEPPTYLLTRGY